MQSKRIIFYNVKPSKEFSSQFKSQSFFEETISLSTYWFLNVFGNHNQEFQVDIPAGKPVLEILGKCCFHKAYGILSFSFLTHFNVELQQTASYFPNKSRFLWDQQRVAVLVLQPLQDRCMYPAKEEENSSKWGTGGWDGYTKRPRLLTGCVVPISH